MGLASMPLQGMQASVSSRNVCCLGGNRAEKQHSGSRCGGGTGVIVEPAEPTNKTPAFPPLPSLDTSTTVLTLITENSFVFASAGETKSKVDVMTGTLFIQAL